MSKQMVKVWLDSLDEEDSSPHLSAEQKSKITTIFANKGYHDITFETIHYDTSELVYYEFKHDIYGVREETDEEFKQRKRREMLINKRHKIACEQAMKSLISKGKLTDGSKHTSSKI